MTSICYTDRSWCHLTDIWLAWQDYRAPFRFLALEDFKRGARGIPSIFE